MKAELPLEMIIRRWFLSESVTIKGFNVFGRSSSITFSPYHEAGWWLKPSDGSSPVPITHKIAKSRRGCICIEAGGTSVPVWEHFGVLRYTGLDCVLVSVPEQDLGIIDRLFHRFTGYFPPYDITINYFKQLWDARKEDEQFSVPQTLESLKAEKREHPDRFIKEIKPKQGGEYSYTTKSRKDSKTKINIVPNGNFAEITMTAMWPGIPHKKEGCVPVAKLVSLQILKDILSCRAQGYPHYMYFFLKLIRWRHLSKVSWRVERVTKNKMLGTIGKEWHDHAYLDTFGTTSLADHVRLPFCNITRHTSGHKADLEALKSAFHK